MPLIAPTIVTCHRCVKYDNEIPCLSGLYIIVNCSTGNTYGLFEISKKSWKRTVVVFFKFQVPSPAHIALAPSVYFQNTSLNSDVLTFYSANDFLPHGAL